MPFRPDLRKALITGANSGIGKSVAAKFTDYGFKTAATDKERSYDANSLFFVADLSSPESIKALIDDVEDKLGTLDILVCCAGIGIHEKLTEGDPESWEHVFRINVFGTMRLIRALVPIMVEQKKGDVIIISSVSANHSYPYGGIYSATKAALDRIAETLRLEVQPEVRVTVIHPGVVNTNFFDHMISGIHTPEDIGWGALEPDQIAETVLFAVSQPPEVMLNDIVMRPAAQPM